MEPMRETSVLERNTERWMKRYRRQVLVKGVADGRRAFLVRLAARRLGDDSGQRLRDRLSTAEDLRLFDLVGGLIVDCETGDEIFRKI